MRNDGWVRVKRHRGKHYVQVPSRGRRPGPRAFLFGALAAIVLAVVAAITVPGLLQTPAKTTPSSPPTSTPPQPVWPDVAKLEHTSYIIQVASEKDRSTAETKAAQLRNQGFGNAKVLRSDDHTLSPDWWVVFIGPYEHTNEGKADAQATKGLLPDTPPSYVRSVGPK